MRRLWLRLTRRPVEFEFNATHGRFAGHSTPVSVERWERWTRPGYYFQTEIKRPGEDWQRVTVFPTEVRDDKGRLVSLRVDLSEYSGSASFWMDGPSLGKNGEPATVWGRSQNYPHT